MSMVLQHGALQPSPTFIGSAKYRARQPAFPLTATCLAMRLLTLIKGTTKGQMGGSISYAEVKTILNKQHSNWRLEHPQYNKTDPYYLLTRRAQVTGQATTASTITCILNSASTIRSMPSTRSQTREHLPQSCSLFELLRKGVCMARPHSRSPQALR